MVKSDKKWRTFKYGYELPTKWRKEKNWLKGEKFDEMNFAYYLGWYYALDEFSAFVDSQPISKDWDGYISETYSSAVVIKVSKNGEQYKIGLALE